MCMLWFLPPLHFDSSFIYIIFRSLLVFIQKIQQKSSLILSLICTILNYLFHMMRVG